MTGICCAHGVWDGLGHADGVGKGVDGLHRVTGEVIGRAPRSEQIGLTAALIDGSRGQERLIKHCNRIIDPAALGQAPGQTRSRHEDSRVIVRITEAVEGGAQRRIGIVVEALGGECGTEHLTCPRGQTGIVFGIADDHERFPCRLVIATLVREMGCALIARGTTLLLGHLGVAQTAVDGTEGLSARAISAGDLVGEGIQIAA